MQETAILISLVVGSFMGIFVAMFLTFLPLWKAEEDKWRKRRLDDARMNARLLRLNL